MAYIDLETFQDLEDEGYITCRIHPSGSLWIWNYTSKTQFEHFWTPETLMARGLITTPEGKIVARPFRKFFNLGEQDIQIPNEPFEVLEKLDGSLLIAYQDASGRYAVATRGSFESDQANIGTRILQDRYKDFRFDPAYTYLFELISPRNRIVVNYGDQEDIVLLAMIHTETGRERSIYKRIPKGYWPFPVARHYDGVKDFATLTTNYNGNQEGYVIRFTKSGLRLKIKYEEYVRAHRVITGTTTQTIWEVLSSNECVERWQELISQAPDELHQWMCRVRSDLHDQYSAISDEACAWVRAVEYLRTTDYAATRKRRAEVLRLSRYPSICFMMLDHKSYRQAIWKLIRPEVERPFSYNPAESEAV